MKYNLIKNYLESDKIYYLYGIICFSFIYVYIQQEYVVLPLFENQQGLSDSLKIKILGQFDKSRWLSFIIFPLVIFIRIILVGCCLYIGSVLFETYTRIKYQDCFNIALKSDVILISSALLYVICIVTIGAEKAASIIQNTSLLAFFDMKTIEPWLIVPIGIFNIFEIGYCFFMAVLLSISKKKTYKESLSFIIVTYGTGLLLYILIMIFTVLYISQ